MLLGALQCPCPCDMHAAVCGASTSADGRPVHVYGPAVLQAGGFDAFGGALSGGQEAASQASAAVAVGDSASPAAFDDKEDLFADAPPGPEAASHSELFGNSYPAGLEASAAC